MGMSLEAEFWKTVRLVYAASAGSFGKACSTHVPPTQIGDERHSGKFTHEPAPAPSLRSAENRGLEIGSAGAALGMSSEQLRCPSVLERVAGSGRWARLRPAMDLIMWYAQACRHRKQRRT